MNGLVLCGHIHLQKPIQQRQQSQIFLQLNEQLRKICTRLLRGLAVEGLLQATKIRSCVEAGLKALGVNLAVLIQNVGIDLGNHVRLCVPRIALCCFDISVV